MNQPRPVRVALIGIAGSGKTEVGRTLADVLSWPFLDADALVVEETGRSISEIFAAEGEPGFRDREADVLRSVSRIAPPLVLATGGGIVDRKENRTQLAGRFFVVWLRVAPEEAHRRLLGTTDRPLLADGDALATLREQAARRTPHMESLARLTVEAGPEVRPTALAGEIARALGDRRR